MGKTYDIVVASDLYKLIEKVNERMAEGWVPAGGPFVNAGYYQAMIRLPRGTEKES